MRVFEGMGAGYEKFSGDLHEDVQKRGGGGHIQRGVFLLPQNSGREADLRPGNLKGAYLCERQNTTN